jgi:hypothetical protein
MVVTDEEFLTLAEALGTVPKLATLKATAAVASIFERPIFRGARARFPGPDNKDFMFAVIPFL